jgi:molybdenum cofactor guanylyltransferase
MLEACCERVFISCKSDKNYPLPCIFDATEWLDIGPIAGLFSAFATDSCAWLVLAVDYPLFMKEDVDQLLAERDENALATVYYHANTGFFEPFLGIYESTFFDVLKKEITKGNYSLQKILQNNAVKKVIPLKEENIVSVDTIAAYQPTLAYIQKNRPLKGMDDFVYE